MLKIFPNNILLAIFVIWTLLRKNLKLPSESFYISFLLFRFSFLPFGLDAGFLKYPCFNLLQFQQIIGPLFLPFSILNKSQYLRLQTLISCK